MNRHTGGSILLFTVFAFDLVLVNTELVSLEPLLRGENRGAAWQIAAKAGTWRADVVVLGEAWLVAHLLAVGTEDFRPLARRFGLRQLDGVIPHGRIHIARCSSRRRRLQLDHVQIISTGIQNFGISKTFFAQNCRVCLQCKIFFLCTVENANTHARTDETEIMVSSN